MSDGYNTTIRTRVFDLASDYVTVRLSNLASHPTAYDNFKVHILDSSASNVISRHNFNMADVDQYDSSRVDMTVSGLSSSTEYYYVVGATFRGTTYWYSRDGISAGGTYFRTEGLPDTNPPTVYNLSSVGYNHSGTWSISFTWKSIDDVGVTGHSVYISRPNSYSDFRLVDDNVSGNSYTYYRDGNNNLISPGNTYHIRVIARDAAGNTSSNSSGTMSLLVSFENPGKWTRWNKYNISPGNRFSSQSSDGKTYYLMTANDWNDFTAHINKVRMYKYHDTRSFTTVGRNTIVSANIVNQAIGAINNMLTNNKIPSLNSNSVVTAKVFNDMVNRLNSLV